MDLRNDLLERATQIASADGRSQPAVLDLVRAAIERGEGQTIMLITMLDHPALKQGQELSPASEDQLDQIFQQAAALALALDQTLAAGHVAAVAARNPAAGRPGLLTMVRQVLIQSVAGPDEQEQLEIRQAFEGLNDEESDRGGWSTGKDIHFSLRAEAPGEVSGDVAPACPRCHRPLTSPLRSEELDSDDGHVLAMLCGNCGVVLGLLPPT